MPSTLISAPIKGWVIPLAQVPDSVFAEKMLGDGVAIDPLDNVLCAPCDATVMTVHHARHAITLAMADGAEMLMHIGLDTVGLGGVGFEVLVQAGQSVVSGQPLIRFDMDRVAQGARSLLTPIIMTQPDRFVVTAQVEDREVNTGDTIFAIEDRSAPMAEADMTIRPADVAARSIEVPLPHGLHARPAARVAQLAGQFSADIALSDGSRSVSAKSAVSILSLGVRHGQRIEIRAEGADAVAAADAIADLIEGGMGEGALPAQPMQAPKPAPAPAPMPRQQADPDDMQGVKAAPGLAIGRAYRLVSQAIEVPEQGEGAAHERQALDDAIASIRTRFETDAAQAGSVRQGIILAHLSFLNDPELLRAAQEQIGGGKSAGFAWRHAVQDYIDLLGATGDQRMAERVDDLIDLQNLVIGALYGTGEDQQDLPPDAILVADELLPSQLMAIEQGAIAALCLARGGPTSHVAILAAARGLPMIVALGADLLAIADGTPMIVDADAARLRVKPDRDVLEAAQAEVIDRAARRQAALASAALPGALSDGTRIEVFANVGSLKDAELAAQNGAEGCGLLRTEFLFLERDTPPTEDEQAADYQAVVTALSGRPVIIRTLDVGGDKTASYLPIPPEDNPALGLRGVRVSLWRPELLKTQLRAILRTHPLGACKIMIPMVASLSDITAVKALLVEAAGELGITEPVELGVMVETPAAAITADLLATQADFLSIGTNDLTQYALAIDRGNPALAAQLDSLHPAVLRLIGQTCDGAAQQGKWVGVCGSLASEALAAPILVGLGVTELSCAPTAVPDVKAALRRFTLADCRAMAAQALTCPSPEEVRKLASAHSMTNRS
ncbi:phosphoenolpyruvate--protein phosphotransferase [Novosphingobium terrae]|uniref:phosphoenolpyruvate--protein phosphotransferase n=1 Tax=Novosphingobium terrae TaxID=2726189 RepID=UPI00197DB191|nr:phosphoenolpyruvate--protein phosphotransferase [Novosphingobium terrae]